MLHRDYILKLVTRFVRVLVPALERVEETGDTQAISEMEAAIASLVELEPVMLLSLTPQSLTTFVELSPNAEAVAPYMVWGLGRVADAAASLDDSFTAELRRNQAQAVADTFGLALDVVPDDIAELLQEDEESKGEALLTSEVLEGAELEAQDIAVQETAFAAAEPEDEPMASKAKVLEEEPLSSARES